ncbi:hypothetical protein KKB18_04085 [bacterium]|nr:hypothetical protein [bacterium]
MQINSLTNCRVNLKILFFFLTSFLITFLSIQLFSFDLSDEKMDELRVKYQAIIEDGILKVKDRNELYNAGEELLTREFENEDIKIQAIYQPPEQINNLMSYLLSAKVLDETSFFSKLYGPEGIFARYYNKNDYLYFAFRLTSKSSEKIDVDKFIKGIKLYDGLGSKVKGEKPKLFKYDEDKKQRIYQKENWTTLPGFEGKDFIWIAFPKKNLKEEAGVYCIELKKFHGARDIQFLWTLPIKFPQCRC